MSKVSSNSGYSDLSISQLTLIDESGQDDIAILPQFDHFVAAREGENEREPNSLVFG